MNKFIVITSPRCGTHMLKTILEKHPEIDMRGEIFNFSNVDGYESFTHAYENLCYGNNISNGFLLHRTQSNKELYDLIEKDDVKIISLTRENVIERYVSYKFAQKNKKWQMYKNTNETTVGKIVFDVNDFKENFEIYQNTIKESEGYIKGKDVVELTYEQIINDHQNSMLKIYDLLGVKPYYIPTSTRKSERRNFKDSIENYSELESFCKENGMLHLLNSIHKEL